MYHLPGASRARGGFVILTFDFGTTTVKGARFDSNGGLEEVHSLAIPLQSNQEPNIHEVDPEEWVRALRTLSGLLTPVGGDAEAIVISGNGPTMVAAGSDGRPLLPGMTWLDRRGTKESAIIKEKCGVDVDPSFYLPKALWIKRNKPALYDKTTHFFSSDSYISYRLTGEAAMVFPGDGLDSFVWTKAMIGALELDDSKFPAFVDFGHRVGAVTASASDEFQLPKGTPVFAGGPDFMMSILGTAAVKPGRACDRAGTSEGVNICCDQRVDDKRLLCYRHIVPEFWNVAGIISTTGKALEWLRESAFGGAFTFESLDRMAGEAKAGAGKLIFLPYLSGERTPIWDSHARGVFFGLALHHRTGDLTRAVLESTGFAIRDVLSVIAEHGIEADELRVAGNPARSDTWNQIKADITGKRILMPENRESELVGDLCIAMTRLGRYSSYAEAAEELVRFTRVFVPRTETGEMYDEMFERYRELYRRLKPVFEQNSGASRQGGR